jgi:hypothetical protein
VCCDISDDETPRVVPVLPRHYASVPLVAVDDNTGVELDSAQDSGARRLDDADMFGGGASRPVEKKSQPGCGRIARSRIQFPMAFARSTIFTHDGCGRK